MVLPEWIEHSTSPLPRDTRSAAARRSFCFVLAGDSILLGQPSRFTCLCGGSSLGFFDLVIKRCDFRKGYLSFIGMYHRGRAIYGGHTFHYEEHGISNGLEIPAPGKI